MTRMDRIYQAQTLKSAGLPACLVDLAFRSCTVCFVFDLCLDFPLGADFLPRLTWTPPLPPPSSSALCLSSFVSTFVCRHDSVSTQTPVYAKPMFCVSSSCFPLRLSLQCAGFDSAHASRNMRMFFFDPISIVVLAIGLLCHSYTFYVPIHHTGGLSIHLLLCRIPFARATFLCMAFPKTLLHTHASV